MERTMPMACFKNRQHSAACLLLLGTVAASIIMMFYWPSCQHRVDMDKNVMRPEQVSFMSGDDTSPLSRWGDDLSSALTQQIIIGLAISRVNRRWLPNEISETRHAYSSDWYLRKRRTRIKRVDTIFQTIISCQFDAKYWRLPPMLLINYRACR